MPWKETRIMDERHRFILDYQRQEDPLAERGGRWVVAGSLLPRGPGLGWFDERRLRITAKRPGVRRVSLSL